MPAGAPRKYTDEDISNWAKHVVEWAQREDSLAILGWRAESGINYERVSKWRQTHPEFREAYDRAKEIIGYRREYGGLNGELNPQMVEKRGWMYDQEVLAHKKEMAQLEKQDTKVEVVGLRGGMDKEDKAK